MVNMDNYEEYLVLYADGELGEAEQKELLAFISQHPELKAEMDMYAATKLVPDEAIVYSGKEQLMKPITAKRTISLRSWWVYGAAAASVVLFIAIGLNNRTEEQIVLPVATTHTEEKNIDTAVYEELHSTPKSPVAVETKHEPVKPVYVAKTHIPANKKSEPKTKEPVIVKNSNPEKHDIPVVAEQPRPVNPRVESHTNETIAAAQRDEAVVTLPLPVEHDISDDRKGLLASLPIKENLQGINALSKSVEEKFEKIKDISEKIRDTDVRFRLGKKELFVVRL